MDCSSLSSFLVPYSIRCRSDKYSNKSSQNDRVYRDGFWYLGIKEYREANRLGKQLAKNYPQYRLDTPYKGLSREAKTMANRNRKIRFKISKMKKENRSVPTALYEEEWRTRPFRNLQDTDRESRNKIRTRMYDAVTKYKKMHNYLPNQGAVHSAYQAGYYCPFDSRRTKAQPKVVLNIQEGNGIKLSTRYRKYNKLANYREPNKLPEDKFLKNVPRSAELKQLDSGKRMHYALDSAHVNDKRFEEKINMYQDNSNVDRKALRKAEDAVFEKYKDIEMRPMSYDEVIASKEFRQNNHHDRGFSGPGFATKVGLAKTSAFRKYHDEYINSQKKATFGLFWKREVIKYSKLEEFGPRPILGGSLEHELTERRALQVFGKNIHKNRWNGPQAAMIGISNPEFQRLSKKHHVTDPDYSHVAIDFSRQDVMMPKAVSTSTSRVLMRIADHQGWSRKDKAILNKAMSDYRNGFYLAAPSGEMFIINSGHSTGRYFGAEGNTFNHEIIHEYVRNRLDIPKATSYVHSQYGDDYLGSGNNKDKNWRLFLSKEKEFYKIVKEELGMLTTTDTWGGPGLNNEGCSFLKRHFVRRPVYGKDEIVCQFDSVRVEDKWFTPSHSVKTPEDSFERSYGYLLLAAGHPELYSKIWNHMNSLDCEGRKAQRFQDLKDMDLALQDYYTMHGHPPVYEQRIWHKTIPEAPVEEQLRWEDEYTPEVTPIYTAKDAEKFVHKPMLKEHVREDNRTSNTYNLNRDHGSSPIVHSHRKLQSQQDHRGGLEFEDNQVSCIHEVPLYLCVNCNYSLGNTCKSDEIFETQGCTSGTVDTLSSSPSETNTNSKTFDPWWIVEFVNTHLHSASSPTLANWSLQVWATALDFYTNGQLVRPTRNAVHVKGPSKRKNSKLIDVLTPLTAVGSRSETAEMIFKDWSMGNALNILSNNQQAGTWSETTVNGKHGYIFNDYPRNSDPDLLTRTSFPRVNIVVPDREDTYITKKCMDCGGKLRHNRRCPGNGKVSRNVRGFFWSFNINKDVGPNVRVTQLPFSVHMQLSNENSLRYTRFIQEMNRSLYCSDCFTECRYDIAEYPVWLSHKDREAKVCKCGKTLKNTPYMFRYRSSFDGTDSEHAFDTWLKNHDIEFLRPLCWVVQYRKVPRLLCDMVTPYDFTVLQAPHYKMTDVQQALFAAQCFIPLRRSIDMIYLFIYLGGSSSSVFCEQLEQKYRNNLSTAVPLDITYAHDYVDYQDRTRFWSEEYRKEILVKLVKRWETLFHQHPQPATTVLLPEAILEDTCLEVPLGFSDSKFVCRKFLN